MSYVLFGPDGPTYPQNQQIPSFSIYKPCSKDKVETLKACFLQNQVLKRSELPSNLCPRDGLVYTCVYDSRMPEGLEEIPVIISFQQHTYGRFAVIRAKDTDKKA